MNTALNSSLNANLVPFIDALYKYVLLAEEEKKLEFTMSRTTEWEFEFLQTFGQ